MTPSRPCCWLLPSVALGLVGCGEPAPPPQPPTVAPAIAPPLTDDLRPNAAVPQQPAKPADPPVTLPDDTGGKAVAKALLVPPPLPTDSPTATKPKPYSSALDRGELPLPPVPPKPLAQSTPGGNAAKPSPPTERHQPDSATAALPEGRATDRPRVKAPAPSNPGAADVPMNGWRQGDRASLDDPTVDLSAGRVIETPLPLVRGQLPFLRTSIPDPFELVEHLKGKLGKDTELGTGPVK